LYYRQVGAIRRAWDQAEAEIGCKMKRYPAYTARQLETVCKEKWGGIRLPLNLRAFLLTPGCFKPLVTDEDEQEDEQEQVREDEDEHGSNSVEQAQQEGIQRRTLILLDPSKFIINNARNWSWTFPFYYESLPDDLMRDWLWLQGLDYSRAGELTEAIMNTNNGDSDVFKRESLPGPVFAFGGSNYYIYYNMVTQSVYDLTSVACGNSEIGDLLDLIGWLATTVKTKSYTMSYLV